MTFARVWVLNFLWTVPLLAVFLMVVRRRRRRALAAFADAALIPRLAPLESRSRAFVRDAFLVVSVLLAVTALAGPRWGERYQEVARRGVDIFLAVDVSRSMLVTDVPPSRLDRAKREIADLIRVASGDRLGLVAFAGRAFVECPLTLDHQALEMYVNHLAPDLVPVQGTDLGAAIEAALGAFDPESPADRAILLFTDGEDNEGRGLAAAREAAEGGVKIFVFGIGDPVGGPVPESGGGGFQRDPEGKNVLSKLDETGLTEIARVTGGTYARSTDGDLDLDRVYFEGILQKTRAATVRTGKITVREERFFVFVLAAFLLLFLEGVLREKATRRMS